HRVDHVLRLRELQDETGGFQVFIPLRYQHDFVDSADGKIRNRLQERTTMAAPAESLKTFAVSRLLFDNVPHVKCFWVMHGLSVVCALLLLPVPLNIWVKLMVAVVVSFALQFVVLRKWRLEMIGQVDASMARRRQEKQQLRAALAGEEKPPEDGDQATR